MSLSSEDVGHRVVVRRVLPGERGPSGGPAYTDVLGTLEEYADQHVVVRRRDDTPVLIDLADVVAAKRIPPPPERRRASRRRGEPPG